VFGLAEELHVVTPKVPLRGPSPLIRSDQPQEVIRITLKIKELRLSSKLSKIGEHSPEQRSNTMSESQEESHQEAIKSDILEALAHPEASEGLYLDNLQVVHEEEDRSPVRGDQLEVLDALKDLIHDGKVKTDESGEKVIFFLA
jgi:DNA-binding TFAR19-related protein (PDSD5 family)